MATVDFPPRIIGGEGVFAAAIALRLQARGIALEIVAPGAPGDAVHDAGAGLVVHRIPVAGSNFITRTLSFAARTRRLVREFRGDAVYALRPVAMPRVPMLAHFHVTRTGQSLAAWHSNRPLAALANRLLAPAERRHARNAAIVAGVNAAMRRELRCDLRPQEDFRVIANGVDAERFSPGDRVAPGAAKVLYVGRLDALKRVPDLLQAVARLHCTHPQLSLTVVGDGRERGRVRACVDDLGIRDRVQFLAPVAHREMPAVYRAHDVLVLPSAYESFGLAALEAMACGTPAITTSACAALGQPMFPVGDVTALCSLLDPLLDCPPRLQALAEQGRRIAMAHGWDAIADQLVEALLSVAQRGPRPHATAGGRP